MVKTLKRGVSINILLSKNYQDSISKLPLAGGTNLKNVKKILKEIGSFSKKNPNKKVGTFNIRWFVDRKGELAANRDLIKKNWLSGPPTQKIYVGR